MIEMLVVGFLAAVGFMAIGAFFATLWHKRDLPQIQDPLEVARSAIIAYHGRADIDLDAFAEGVAKVIRTACEASIQNDRIVSGRKAEEEKRATQAAEEDRRRQIADVEAEHRRKLELERQPLALAEEAKRLAEERAVRDAQRPGKLKIIADLRNGAAVHLNDNCRCVSAKHCLERQTDALIQAQRLEEDL